MRAIIALRENGNGYAGLESVCGYVNLVPPMNVNSFNKSMGDIISSYKQCAEDSMNSAAENVRQMNNEITVDNEKIVDIVVSSDGAWQKRGHDSLNGVVTIIQNDVGQCIDYSFLRNAMSAQSGKLKKTQLNLKNLFQSMNAPLIIQDQPGQWKQKVWLNFFNLQLKIENCGILNSLGMETLKYTHQLLQLTRIQE